MNRQYYTCTFLLITLASLASVGCGETQYRGTNPAIAKNGRSDATAPNSNRDVPVVASRAESSPSVAVSPNSSADLSAVVKGLDEFSCDLFGSLSARRSGNLFFSPASISTALAMTYAGARGETEAQMADVLHFTLPQKRLHPVMRSLAGELRRDDGGYRLLMANRLWGQRGVPFMPDFLEIIRENYGAELGRLDFKTNSESATETINKWVAEQTDNKIQQLIARDVLDKLTQLVLVNAVYFKSKWASQFKTYNTSSTPFQISKTRKVDVPLMWQKDAFKYRAVKDLQILELPFAGHGVSMIVLLPKTTDGLGELETRLNSENLAKWLTGLQLQEVHVFLPRFRLTSQFQLNDVLLAMGMTSAFSPRTADLSRMTGEPNMFISAVIHKAHVVVNEEGSQAAAATVVSEPKSAPPRRKPKPTPVFRADHPFVFLIRHNKTGSILFLGRLVDPRQ
jgi:serpin B